jgi:hypothetical protein
MPFVDPWFRQGSKTSPLDFERRMFEATQNPIHAWRALQTCIEAGCDGLPEWVLAYFRTATAAVQELFIDDGLNAPMPIRLAEALGFKRAGRGVRRDAVERFNQESRDSLLAAEIWGQMRSRPDASQETIIAAVAERRHLSEETVRRAWVRWRRFITAELDKQVVTTSRKS